MRTLFDLKSKLQQDFENFDRENPEVWSEFRRIAFSLIDKGRKNYGAKAIFEIIRYHRTIYTNDIDFKLNNNLTAYYARKFVNLYPEYKGFFETRKIKDE